MWDNMQDSKNHSEQIEKERLQYLVEKYDELAEIIPSKRLKTLFSQSSFYFVDSKIPIIKYCQMSNHLLTVAKNYEKNKNVEQALSTYLKYKSLIKNIRLHANKNYLQIGINASFDYNLKYVNKQISYLSGVVFEFYQRNYYFSQESIKAEKESRYFRGAMSSPDSIFCSLDQLLKLNEDLQEYASKKVKKIFPRQQIKAFEKLYFQRKTVRHLRTITIPSQVSVAFSYISKENTKNNIETMAYLAGKEENFGLVITHMIIPRQQGQYGSFKVLDYKRVINYLECEDLITLGWIHSHPVDGFYLSSPDMHYQSVFQSILPEAIAMVFSSKEMNTQIFNLNPKTGLPEILKCKKTGFHTHKYTDPPMVMPSQHAIMDLKGPLTVKDFSKDNEQLSYHEDAVQVKIYGQNNSTKKKPTVRPLFSSNADVTTKKLNPFKKGSRKSSAVTFRKQNSSQKNINSQSKINNI